MDFAKDDKGFVIWWIDRQFATIPTFPDRCCYRVKKSKSISRHHVQAYREWTKVPMKRRKIEAWINDWMTDAEQNALKEAIDHQHLHRVD